MTTVISEVGLFTVANGAIIGPKLDEVNVRLGTFVDVIITSTLNGIPIDQFVLASNVQTLRNKSFEDTTCRFIDAVDTTKFINFDCDGLTGTGTTIAAAQTANRTLTMPDTSDTFAVLAFPQTFTNKTITGATNTVEASALRTTGAAVVISAAAPPIAGHVLTALTPTTAAWAAGGGGGGGPPFDDATFTVTDVVDPSIQVMFDVAGTTGTSTTIRTAQVANRIYTIPDSGADTSFVMLAGAQTIIGTKTIGDLVITNTLNTQPIANIVYTTTVQTLTNKTLTTPTIAQILNVGTLTLPTSTDTLVGRATTDTLTNKNLSDTTTFIIDSVTPTIRIGFNAAGTAATTTTITSSQTANRVITLPDVTDTLVGLAATQTLTNKTITGATNVVDANALKTTGASVNVAAGIPPTVGQVLTATSATTATWQTNAAAPTVFTDTDFAVTDTVDPTKSVRFDVIGSTGTVTTLATTSTVNRTLTLPDATDTLVGTDTAQTLTNKNLDDVSTYITDTVDPTIRLTFEAAGTAGTTTTLQTSQTTDRVITLPNLTTTLVGLTTTDTLFNKTIQGVTNTVHANAIKTNGISVTTTAASPPTTGQVLTAVTATTANWQTPATTFTDTTFAVTDTVDPTKSVAFDVIGSTGTVTTLATTSTVNRTLSFPDATDTLVGLAATQTLTNKNLSDTTTFIVDSVTPTIRIGFNAAGTAATTTTITSSQTVNRTLTLPNATDTFAVLALAQTFTNKNLTDTSTFITDVTTPSIRIGFNAAGTAATTTTIASSQTANRTLTMPDATDTFAVLALAQTFTNKTITGSTNTVDAAALRTTGAAVNVSAGIPPTVGQVLTATAATTATWQDPIYDGPPFSDNIFSVFQDADPSSQVVFQVVGSPGTTATIQTANTANRTYIIPEVGSNANFIMNVGAQTLSDKRLIDSTTTIVNGGNQTIRIGFAAAGSVSTITTILATQTTDRILTMPDADDTFAVLALAQTFTNKTITGSTNTVDASALRTTGAAVNVSAAAPPTVGQVLTATSATTATWQAGGGGGGPPFSDATFVVQDDTDNTIQLAFDVAGTTGTTATIATAQVANRTYTIPDSGNNVNFIMSDGTQTINGFKTFTGRHIFALFDTQDPLLNVWLGSGSGNGTLTGTSNVGIGINSLQVVTSGEYNVGICTSALTAITTGVSNIGIGLGAGGSLTTGGENIALGVSALSGCVSGNDNIAFGRFSLSNATNSFNIGLGFQTGQSITSGVGNIALGSNTLSSVNVVGAPTPINASSDLTVVGNYSAAGASGSRLTIFGSNNLRGQTSAPFAFATGSTNVIVGDNILPENATSSADNILIGTDMGASLAATNFSNNILIGHSVLNTATTSSNNTICGNDTAVAVTTASQNIIFGGTNANTITTAGSNTIVGYNNLNGPTTQISGSIIIGRNNYNSVATSGPNTYNIFIGNGMAGAATSAIGNIGIGANGGAGSVFAAITSASANIAIGDSSCTQLTDGSNNTVIGAASFILATTAANNTTVGSAVLTSLVSGTQNVGIGYNTASFVTGDNNVCIGAISGNLFTSGAGNVTVGFNTGSPNPGATTVNTNSNNTLIGTNLGLGNTGAGLYMLGYNNFRSQAIGPFGAASGSDNIAIGRDIVSGLIARTAATNIFIGSVMATNATSANNNVAIGHASVGALTTGTNNVIIGCNAGTTLTTGQFNTLLGDLAEVGPAFTNCVALGYGASVTFGNNTVTLGNPATVRLEAQVALTVLSDARYKEDIEDLSFGTEFIKALKPKKYKITKSDVQRYGFLAQDIEETMVEQRIIEPFDKKNNQMDGILSYNAHDDKYSMSYEGLMAPMIKMMQEMQARIEALEAALAAK